MFAISTNDNSQPQNPGYIQALVYSGKGFPIGSTSRSGASPCGSSTSQTAVVVPGGKSLALHVGLHVSTSHSVFAPVVSKSFVNGGWKVFSVNSTVAHQTTLSHAARFGQNLGIYCATRNRSKDTQVQSCGSNSRKENTSLTSKQLFVNRSYLMGGGYHQPSVAIAAPLSIRTTKPALSRACCFFGAADAPLNTLNTTPIFKPPCLSVMGVNSEPTTQCTLFCYGQIGRSNFWSERSQND